MGNYRKLAFALTLQCLSIVAQAQQVSVNALRYWTTPDQSRITLTMSGKTEHRVFIMNDPARLVIDIPNASLNSQLLTQPESKHPLFSSIRASIHNTDLRVVIDLKKSISTKTAALHANVLEGNKLVIEVLDKGLANQIVKDEKTKSATVAKLATQKQSVSIPQIQNKENSIVKNTPETLKNSVKKITPEPVKVVKSEMLKHVKPFIVAIDAGHGGDDAGAKGANGTREKDVVFSIAKRLESLINAQTNMKAIMVRQGDYFVGLRKRMDIARAAKADLFISIHADANKDASAHGASVFTLSEDGASSEAAHWLADSENASDLIGDTSGWDNDENGLNSVLINLSQNATQEASVNLANRVLHNFDTIGELHFGTVQKAGFAVLKSPDIPSILVETAFISNPSEESKLLNASYQTRIATAIFEGVYSYSKQRPNELPVTTGSRIARLY